MNMITGVYISFYSYFLAATAALEVQMSVCLSVCVSVTHISYDHTLSRILLLGWPRRLLLAHHHHSLQPRRQLLGQSSQGHILCEEIICRMKKT